MGADKPALERNDIKVQTPFPRLLSAALVLLAVVALFRTVEFTDEYEAPKLSPKEELRLLKRLKEIDDAEQYALVATEDGWYPCNHPGRTVFHLLPGEVWKYGTTTKGKYGRYSIRYLDQINISYVVEYRGTISECLKEEQRKLYGYPYLPENLVRDEINRLPRPPYNSKLQ